MISLETLLPKVPSLMWIVMFSFRPAGVSGLKVEMPALSPTMEEGNIVKWLKKEGKRNMWHGTSYASSHYHTFLLHFFQLTHYQREIHVVLTGKPSACALHQIRKPISFSHDDWPAVALIIDSMTLLRSERLWPELQERPEGLWWLIGSRKLSSHYSSLLSNSAQPAASAAVSFIRRQRSEFRLAAVLPCASVSRTEIWAYVFGCEREEGRKKNISVTRKNTSVRLLYPTKLLLAYKSVILCLDCLVFELEFRWIKQNNGVFFHKVAPFLSFFQTHKYRRCVIICSWPTYLSILGIFCCCCCYVRCSSGRAEVKRLGGRLFNL